MQPPLTSRAGARRLHHARDASRSAKIKPLTRRMFQMKQLLFLLPLLLGMSACGAQPLPAQDVGNAGNIASATPTATAQSTPQEPAPSPAHTPVPAQNAPSGLHYYWPAALPEGFALNASNSSVSENGFVLEFINPSTGTIHLSGGEPAAQYPYCAAGSTAQEIRGTDGCFPQSTGGGFSAQWKEGGFTYSVGGFGLSREAALEIAEQLEILDFNTWQDRLELLKQ